MAKSNKIIFLVLGALVLLAVQEFIDLPGNSRLWGEIQNTGHTPLFGVISIIILRLLALSSGKRRTSVSRQYLISFILTIAIGAASEAAQLFENRDADIWDFVRDTAGAIAFLGLAFSIDRRVDMGEKFRRLKLWARSIGVVAMIGALVPLTLWSIAYIDRDRAFPIICNFESVLEAKFYDTLFASYSISGPPNGWDKKDGKRVGKILFQNVNYPQFSFEEPYPDWRGYSYLVFDSYLDSDSLQELGLLIWDSESNQSLEDRYNGKVIIKPGLNHIRVLLDEIMRGPQARPMDMTSIIELDFELIQPVKPTYLYLDDIRLEK
jgi:VanZ family protein